MFSLAPFQILLPLTVIYWVNLILKVCAKFVSHICCTFLFGCLISVFRCKLFVQTKHVLSLYWFRYC